MIDTRILVTRSSMPSFDEYTAEIASLWESHWLTNMGAKHKKFEMELQKRLGVSNIALFVNGHAALECILEALQLKGEVITTPFSFASTTHAIKRKGLTPVFADIKPDDFTIDPASIERLITPRTSAIVPVHVYGNLCDVEAIRDIAERYELKVIYDAAHAFGVERYNSSSGEWESAAAFGDASMFSFHATKVFNSIEGGAVCFRDSGLYDILNGWKNFGITGPESVEYVGGNAKMNEFCAAMGICNLRHLDAEIAKRKVVAEQYYANLSNVPGIKLLEHGEGVRHNYAYMPIVLEESFGATRDEVFDALANEGVGARKYFYPLISDFDCYRAIYSSDRTPVAKDVAACVLTLPMYADLMSEEVDRICEIVKRCK